MNNYIVSLDFQQQALSVHIISQEPFGKTKTTLTTCILTPSKLRVIKKILEKPNLAELAEWFKQEYDIPHSHITISLGPEIRNWLYERYHNKKGEK